MDLEPEVILEDGEISNDDDEPESFPKTAGTRLKTKPILEDVELSNYDDYTPLERPSSLINSCTKPLENHDDTDSWGESQSDSDDNRIKKPKIKKKLLTKRKKYDIWSSHVQEDVLTETLVSCGVSKIDRSRDVESYQPFNLRHKLNKKRHGHKRRHDEKYDKNVSMRRKDDNAEDIKGSKRLILDLVTNEENTDEEVAKDIANKLCEEKDDLIMRTVRIAGKKKCIEIFNDTKRIELDGGMLIMNQTRRRTPGGVFIFLLKRDTDITDEQQKEIFSEEKREQTREKKALQKAKLKAIKDQIKVKKAANDNLPLLLTRSKLELEVQKADTLRDRNESEPEEFVNNPPPSPVTDGKENSNDGLNIPNYFLESGNGVDMDVL